MAGEGREQAFKEALHNYLGPVVKYLDDPKVTEVLINGHEEGFIEHGGKLHATDAKFSSEDELLAGITAIANYVDRRIDEENPRLDARLPDGSRIHAVIRPCARSGPTVAIRKFSQVKVDFKKYIEWGAVTPEAAQFLEISMFLGKNILVSGGTGSGKTTLLGLLCGRIPPGQRIIVIEDASELTIHYEHVVRFETKTADIEGNGAVTIYDLLKSSLRLRPDRIIVGEVRGHEAFELIQAMNTGHKGCLGTIHSNSAEDALVRLESLALGAGGVSERALTHSIGSAIDLVVQISRLRDGSRRIMSISEVEGKDERGNYLTRDIYNIPSLVLQPDGSLKGDIAPTGEIPTFMNEIEENKIPFPKSRFLAPQKKPKKKAS
ncbi:MAG: CpaF family protein [Bdellovibrionales bacterium]|nr:CpaF family protein [Bdellovibrionales bacterium]